MSQVTTQRRAMLATGFVADGIGEASIFPSAGGNSSMLSTQAVYWRCVAVLFFSARLFNPELRLVLFSNIAPPVVDGIDVAALLDRWNVERVILPLAHRLPAERAKHWGNVFYVLDIIEYLLEHDPDAILALVDCDVLVTDRLSVLFERTASIGNAGYALGTDPREGGKRPDTHRNGDDRASGSDSSALRRRIVRH